MPIFANSLSVVNNIMQEKSKFADDNAVNFIIIFSVINPLYTFLYLLIRICMKYMRILSVSIFIITFNPAYAEEGPGILKIFEQFVTSNAAASRCIKPDNETLTDYQANFLMVSIYASQELVKQYPKYTRDQVAGAMKRKSDLISQKVFEIVSEKGCDDPSVKEEIKRFNAQAKWKPGK